MAGKAAWEDTPNPGLTPSFRRSLPETGCLSQGLPHGKRLAEMDPLLAHLAPRAPSAPERVRPRRPRILLAPAQEFADVRGERRPSSRSRKRLQQLVTAQVRALEDRPGRPIELPSP